MCTLERFERDLPPLIKLILELCPMFKFCGEYSIGDDESVIDCVLICDIYWDIPEQFSAFGGQLVSYDPFHTYQIPLKIPVTKESEHIIKLSALEIL